MVDTSSRENRHQGFLYSEPSHGGILTFNADDGYLEALCRGHRGALLTQADYTNLAQCDTLDDVKLHLAQTDYGDFLQNEPSPIATITIEQKCRDKFIDEFNYLRSNAAEPLALFLDYITYQYMIDNVVMLIQGTLHGRDQDELLTKCHPLGMFKQIQSLFVAQNIAELYRMVLIDTPLGPYLSGYLSEEDLDEMNVEVMRNTLYKAYLEDFYNFCVYLGGETADVMSKILMFEADRRAITITINSFGTQLNKDDRAKLYPSFGFLYPAGTAKLAKADDFDQVRASVDYLIEYRTLFSESQSGVGEDRIASWEDSFFIREVAVNREAFQGQMGYGCFYALVRLKEQEIRNLLWIAECINQRQKDRMMQNVINVF